jgi:hypothetical protein
MGAGGGVRSVNEVSTSPRVLTTSFTGFICLLLVQFSVLKTSHVQIRHISFTSQEPPLELKASYSVHREDLVNLRFSHEVPHFPRTASVRQRAWNDELLSRVTEIPRVAASMEEVNRRCFSIETNPLENTYEIFLRALVTVDGFECVTDCGRYFLILRASPFHAVQNMCEAVAELVRAHFYPDCQLQFVRSDQCRDELLEHNKPLLHHN